MWAVHALIALAIAIILNSATSHLLGPNGAVARFVLVACLTGAGLAGALLIIFGLTAEMLAAFLIFCFGCELYLFLFTLTMSSVSANIIMLLRHHEMRDDE